MEYATAQQAIQDGSIIYGQGNVKAVRKRNGFIYWPTQAGVAMDAAPKESDTVQAKIQRAKRIVARNAEDDAAIRKLFPSLLAAANDDAESEQASFDEDSPDNEVEGASYEDTFKATVDYWNNVKRQNSQRAYAKSSGVYQPVPTAVRNKAKAADSVALNAKRSRKGTYSMFAHPERSRKAS